MGAIPCPFCGSLKELEFGEHTGEDVSYIVCKAKECGISGPAARNKRTAVTKWNRHRAMALCLRFSKITGLVANAANMVKTDPVKADRFIHDCNEQAKRTYIKCCESWGKELTDEVIDYATPVTG